MSPLKKPSYQLTLELDLPEPLDEYQKPPKPQEAALLLEQARQAFEDRLKKPAWYEDYELLILGGWSFRVAMYIAWAASPTLERTPQTLKELAPLMGLRSVSAIHTWRRKNPAIDQQVSIMQAAPFFKRRADLFKATLDVAIEGGYKGHNDRKMALTMLGDYQSVKEIRAAITQKSVEDISEMSDEELYALMERMKQEQGDAE